MSTLREALARAITGAESGDRRPSEERQADAALSALRQWLADEGLVVVLKSRSDWLHEAVKDASLRAAKNGSVAPELMYAPILWAMQDAIAAAPDVLNDSDGAPPSPGAITGIRKAETPCSDCIDGWCQLNCGPRVG